MLIAARKTPLLERALAAYGRRLLRRGFARVWVGGAAWPAGDGPTIAYLNHGAWWDPLVALFLARDVFRRDAFGLMEGAQLRRYPFFRRVGAFGGDPHADAGPLAAARAVAQHGADLLRGAPRRSVWIFPQGELLPPRAPLAFRSGAARLARAVPEALVVPVALRYELRAEQRPECFARVGHGVDAARRESAAALTRRLEQRLHDELARLDADLARHDDPADAGYRVALRGRGSLSALYDRSLGLLARRGAYQAVPPPRSS